MKIPLIRGKKASSDVEWRDSLPVNMVGYPSPVADAAGYLRTADGLSLFAEGLGIDRGGVWNERLQEHLRVSGTRLIRISQFGAVDDLAEVPGSGQVQFAQSFNTQGLVADGEFYLWDGTDLTLVTKPSGAGDFLDVVWVDGYYILCDSENVWNTDLGDESSISAINFAGSDFSPDPIVGLGVGADGKLLVFNRYTTDKFYNAAGPQFPFARIPGASIPIGIVGPRAKARIGDGGFVVFGGSKEYSPSFYLLTNSYQSLANREIDSIIDEYSDFELFSMSIEFRDTRDQSLTIAHMPRDTLVHDMSMSQYLGEQIWYQFKSDGGRWRAINGVYDPRNVDDEASAWIYGDRGGSNIGKLNKRRATQYGQPQEWVLQSPLFVAGGTVRQLEVLPQPGHTVEDDPVVFISTTKDGVLFGPEVLLSQGKQGEYQKRLIARRLGDYPNLMGIKIRGFSRSLVALSGLEVM